MASVRRILSPTEWVERQIDNLKAVGKKEYEKGIKSPKADPIQRGIDTEEKWANRVKEAIENESRKKGLSKTNMAEWYKMSSELGAGNLVAGVEKRRHKVERFVKEYAPALETHLAAIDAMDEDTDTAREEKMLANLRGLKEIGAAL